MTTRDNKKLESALMFYNQIAELVVEAENRTIKAKADLDLVLLSDVYHLTLQLREVRRSIDVKPNEMISPGLGGRPMEPDVPMRVEEGDGVTVNYLQSYLSGMIHIVKRNLEFLKANNK